MQLLNDPSLSQNGFVFFFSKQTLWWINTRRGVQYSAEGVSVETAVKHLRMCGCCRGQATDRVILWTTIWARKLKLLFKLLWSKLKPMRKPVPLKVMCVKSFDCSINFPLTPLRLQILTERLISLFFPYLASQRLFSCFPLKFYGGNWRVPD